MKANLAFALVTGLVVALCLVLYKAPDPFADEGSRFLDRFGLVSELGLQLQAMFPDAVIVGPTSSYRCVKKEGDRYGNRHVLRSNGQIVDHRGWCWR